MFHPDPDCVVAIFVAPLTKHIISHVSLRHIFHYGQVHVKSCIAMKLNQADLYQKTKRKKTIPPMEPYKTLKIVPLQNQTCFASPGECQGYALASSFSTSISLLMANPKQHVKSSTLASPSKRPNIWTEMTRTSLEVAVCIFWRYLWMVLHKLLDVFWMF